MPPRHSPHYSADPSEFELDRSGAERVLERRRAEIDAEHAREGSRIKSAARTMILLLGIGLAAERVAHQSAAPRQPTIGPAPARAAQTVPAPAPERRAQPKIAHGPSRPTVPREATHDRRPEWAVKLGVEADTIADADQAITAAMRTKAFREHARDLAGDHDLLTAIAIKESTLRSRVQSEARARGLFQLTPIALEELNRRHGLGISGHDLDDPATNALAGALYFRRSIEQVQKLFPSETDPVNLRKLALIDYNAGTGLLADHVRSGDTFDTFVRRLSGELNRRLKGGNAKTLHMVHPSYGVAFDIHPGVLAYLDRRANGDVPAGRIGDYSVMRVGDALLYSELIPAIAERLHDAPPAWIAAPTPVTLTAQKGIWSVSDEVLNHLAGRTAHVPLRGVRTYERRTVARNAVTVAILRYNNRANPDFAALGIRPSAGADVPPGTTLLIPSLAAFEEEFTALRSERSKGKHRA